MKVSLLLLAVFAVAAAAQPMMQNPMQANTGAGGMMGIGGAPMMMPNQQVQFGQAYPLQQQVGFGPVGDLQQQPVLGGFGNTLGGVGMGMQQQVPLSWMGGVQQQQPILSGFGGMQQMQQPINWQQQLGLGVGGFQQQQPINWAGIQQQQPILGFGGAQQVQPILGGAGAWTQQQPITGTVGAVLPQNFGAPSAMFGQLGQPVLSSAQAQQLIPVNQLQQQLEQRVGAFQQPIGQLAPLQGQQQVLGNVGMRNIGVGPQMGQRIGA